MKKSKNKHLQNSRQILASPGSAAGGALAMDPAAIHQI
jgi:hypothetical protein